MLSFEEDLRIGRWVPNRHSKLHLGYHSWLQSGDICPFAPQVQQLQSLKLSLARVWARLKVLLVGVILVDLASVRLDPWYEALVGPVLCPDLYVMALDLDHHDLHREKVLLELLA
ncbi:UNVERIFIED_CONTAM: hypothetical protein Sindi_2580500 [Sesamum indicum]